MSAPVDSFADRVALIEPFRVVEVLERARALEAAGKKIIHMEVGEPDFELAEPIREAAKHALDQGHTLYSAATGIIELREAIAHWYGEQFNVDVSPRRVMITPGASGALLLIASSGSAGDSACRVSTGSAAGTGAATARGLMLDSTPDA